MIFAVIATGPSLTREQVARVRHLRCVVVSDAFQWAPWAEALVSGDIAWWQHHKPEFAGRRFSANRIQGGELLLGVPRSTNSGAQAVHAAIKMGAKKIILLGFDGRGTHFFGEHPAGLKNTTADRRVVHMVQHKNAAAACKRCGVEIFNCSPGTVIEHYPTARLDECLKHAAAGRRARTSTNCAA